MCAFTETMALADVLPVVIRRAASGVNLTVTRYVSNLYRSAKKARRS